VKPLSSTFFASTMASVDTMFRSVEECFRNIEGRTIEENIPAREMVEKLFANQEYRAELGEFADFVIFIVDTIAEAEIEVFEVPGCTKMLQQMLRTYISEIGNWFNSFLLNLLTQPEFIEYFVLRNDDLESNALGVDLDVDFKVLSDIAGQIENPVSLESLFPEVVQYCNHHSWHTKNVTQFPENGGCLTLQMLAYNAMVNVSDTTGKEKTELIPFWEAILKNSKWDDAIFNFGCFVLVNQTDEVSLSKKRIVIC
jgi:hypothetical protein